MCRNRDLKHAFIAEAKVAVMADHNMVEHAHAHDVAHVFQTLGDVDVFAAWRRIAAWMIVHEDDAGGRFADDRMEDFARVDQRCGPRRL